MKHFERLVVQQSARMVGAVVARGFFIPRALRLDLAQLRRAAQAADAGMRPAVQHVLNHIKTMRRIRIGAEEYGSAPPVNFQCFSRWPSPF